METKTPSSHAPTPSSDRIDHYELILEALADVDHGRIISHQDVKTWAHSLSTDAPLKPPTYEG